MLFVLRYFASVTDPFAIERTRFERNFELIVPLSAAGNFVWKRYAAPIAEPRAITWMIF